MCLNKKSELICILVSRNYYRRQVKKDLKMSSGVGLEGPFFTYGSMPPMGLLWL